MAQPRNLSVGVLTTRRDALVRQLARARPLLQGSLATVGVTCGNPGCRCARGQRHTKHLLTRKVSGKTKNCYVPVAMLTEVKAWTAEYRRIKHLIKAISALNEQLLRAVVPSRRARTANQAGRPSRGPRRRVRRTNSG
jgi:hypothetical protein